MGLVHVGGVGGLYSRVDGIGSDNTQHLSVSA